MAWIRSDQTLWNHPKTLKAADLLGIPRAQIVGHLHGLWYWAVDYAQDGDLSRYTAGMIEAVMDWKGEPGALVDALVNCGHDGPGFLERDDQGQLKIHDWYDYAGRLILERQANAERMRKERAAHVRRTCDARAGERAASTNEENRDHIDNDTYKIARTRAREDVGIVVDFARKHLGTSPHVVDQVLRYVEGGMEPDCVLRALEIAVEQGKPRLTYVKAILDRWREAAIRTREQAEYAEEQFRRHKRPGKDPPQVEYRRLTPEEKARSEQLTREIQALSEKMAVKDK